jgi:hypothetical protein
MFVERVTRPALHDREYAATAAVHASLSSAARTRPDTTAISVWEITSPQPTSASARRHQAVAARWGADVHGGASVTTCSTATIKNFKKLDPRRARAGRTGPSGVAPIFVDKSGQNHHRRRAPTIGCGRRVDAGSPMLKRGRLHRAAVRGPAADRYYTIRFAHRHDPLHLNPVPATRRHEGWPSRLLQPNETEVEAITEPVKNLEDASAAPPRCWARIGRDPHPGANGSLLAATVEHVPAFASRPSTHGAATRSSAASLSSWARPDEREVVAERTPRGAVDHERHQKSSRIGRLRRSGER